MVGVGAAIPVTCALATLQTKRAGMIAANNENRKIIFRLRIALPQRAPINFATLTLGVGL